MARMVSPETRLSVSPSSKAASAAISKVQRLVPYPNSLGERWSISLKVSALCSSKAARVRFGREEPALRAPRPLSSKSWDGVPDRLGAASQTPSDLGRGLSTRTCQKNLASTQNKGVFGAQPGFQSLALLLGQRTYEDWRFHEDYHSSSHTIYSDDALGKDTQS